MFHRAFLRLSIADQELVQQAAEALFAQLEKKRKKWQHGISPPECTALVMRLGMWLCEEGLPQ